MSPISIDVRPESIIQVENLVVMPRACSCAGAGVGLDMTVSGVAAAE